MGLGSVSGVVRNLHIAKGYDDVIFTQGKKSAIGVGAVAAAATGNALSSTVLSSFSHGAEIDMEFFSCTVGDQRLQGKFHKVGFKEGDLIEFVVSEGIVSAEVYAARDSSRRLIWTLPYHAKGHIAQKRSCMKWSLLISVGSAIAAPFLTPSTFSLADPRFLAEALWLSGPVLLITLVISLHISRPFYAFSVQATEVFRVLGVEHPELVDLPRHHRRADRDYYKTKGEQATWLFVPWQFRYPG